MTASGQTRPRPSNALTHRDLGDELLFYDGSGDQVHVLNGTARDLYLMCDGSRTLDEVIDRMCEQYDADRATIAADARRIVGQLAELGILTAS